MEGKSKSPSFCRLCDTALASPDVWRQHAKSDWHIHNLRVRVAEPGTVVSPPSPPASIERAVDDDEAGDDSDESDESDDELSAQPEFKPGQCLFCSAGSDSFDDSLAHMSSTHSFAIPHQASLTVHPETLVRYLHLVIHGRGECILCAARRASVEAIQHHMAAKGHCRFDVVSGVARFYDIDIAEPGCMYMYRAGDESLRLPLGNVLSHRTRAVGPAAPRRARQSGDDKTNAAAASSLSLSPSSPSPSPSPSPSSAQLSRLSRNDQHSLARLPNPQLQSLLATAARHIDQSRRQETHAQLKLEQAGNTTLAAHFRADTSKRFRGPWG
ncbi:C2H2 type zinc-finger domain-containing protein [Trichoderma ceciliae]